ncbi:hypothetical protein CHS0354_030484 [Potamilus streckersoni]|uniref:Uncharacterized protein n=1 Tax=Potamilus streckersoni TaxID=2493646 RepID=A0AAE0VGM0_9BIVA|nr:hypothetical protein CHS0354_030484 [Potamilus streckersoni]
MLLLVDPTLNLVTVTIEKETNRLDENLLTFAENVLETLPSISVAIECTLFVLDSLVALILALVPRFKSSSATIILLLLTFQLQMPFADYGHLASCISNATKLYKLTVFIIEHEFDRAV